MTALTKRSFEVELRLVLVVRLLVAQDSLVALAETLSSGQKSLGSLDNGDSCLTGGSRRGHRAGGRRACPESNGLVAQSASREEVGPVVAETALVFPGP